MGDCRVVILEIGLEPSRGLSQPWLFSGAVIHWSKSTASKDLPDAMFARQELCCHIAPSSKSRGFTSRFRCMLKEH